MKHLDEDQLHESVRRLVAALNPEAIYLYGSHAYGKPRPDSDVDLLVVVKDSDLPPHQRAAIAYRALRGLRFPAEIKVVTRAELRRRAGWRTSVERAALEKGILLHADATS